MSVAAYRIRKRVAEWRESTQRQSRLVRSQASVKELESTIATLDRVLSIVDEEVEAEAEREFTRPIIPQGSYLSGS